MTIIRDERVLAVFTSSLLRTAECGVFNRQLVRSEEGPIGIRL